jgi:hypothetical protein
MIRGHVLLVKASPVPPNLNSLAFDTKSRRQLSSIKGRILSSYGVNVGKR